MKVHVVHVVLFAFPNGGQRGMPTSFRVMQPADDS